MPERFSHLKIFNVFIFLRFILAHRPFGIILFILSSIPPPVMFAHPFKIFLSTSFNTSFT